MSCIFLSAGIPLPDHDAKYQETADIIAIRDSIRALVSVVIPAGRIVFGGHPAVTPLVRLLARGLTPDVRQHVTLFQTRFYQQEFPPEVANFEEVNLIDAVNGEEKASLWEMRRAMIRSQQFDAGIFLGGLDGVEREYELFREIHPSKPAFPIASTGAAARILFDKYASDRVELLSDLRYLSLFRRLLNIE